MTDKATRCDTLCFCRFAALLVSVVLRDCTETEAGTVRTEFLNFKAMIVISVPVIDDCLCRCVARFPLRGGTLAGCGGILPVSEEATAPLHQSA